MDLQLPGNSLQLPGNLQLPKGTTLESLYQISDQSIWFLIWILKKHKFWPDLTREVLEEPYTVKRQYVYDTDKLYGIFTKRNDKLHGISRRYCENIIVWENHWKNNLKHGIDRAWFDNGDRMWTWNWTNGKQDYDGGSCFCPIGKK